MSAVPVRSVAIIGGGVSGTLTAVQLARLKPAATRTRIVLFERTSNEGRGLAYATAEPGHLLNVRAANMSVFPDLPGHFEAWLARNADEGDIRVTSAGDFVPRGLFGRYLHDVLRQACQDDNTGCIDLRRADIHAVCRQGNGFVIRGDGVRDEEFDDVVLAMGNVTAGDDRSGRIVYSPWSPNAVDGLDPQQPVLIQGTGLTMIDTVIALRRQGFSGPIIAFSRRGLLPHVHAPAYPQSAPDFSCDDLRHLSGLLRQLRTWAREVQAQGHDWRGLVDALRPMTQSIWQRLAMPQRRCFLRHIRPFWDIHRHRIAPPTAAALQDELASGGLRVIAGRMVSCTAGPDDVAITFRPRGQTATHALKVQRVISATGIPSLGDTREPLIAQLIADGLATLDPLEIGLDVDSEFAVRDAGRDRVSGLWALGPVVRGVFWECTAVPDIRDQAMRLATLIVDRHHRQTILIRQPADATTF